MISAPGQTSLLRILVVEDQEDDADLNLRALRRAGYEVVGRRVEDLDELRAALREEEWHLVLSDHSMPRLTSHTVLQTVQTLAPMLPCIIVSGHIGEEAAVDALRAGAVDYVNKQHLARLVPAVERALREVAERRGRLAAEAQVRTSIHRFEALVQHSTDLIAVLTPDGTPTYISPSVEPLLGFSAAELMERNFLLLIDSEEQRADSFFGAVLGAPGTSLVSEFATRHRDGTRRWLDVVATNLIADPSVQGVVINARDVTERHILEEQLRHQAFHDALTGLPNRALFLDRVEHALREPRQAGQPPAVLVVDLDRFKVINDTFGHATGDRILIEIAARLERCLDPGETLARCGEDEFAILVRPQTARARAVAVAEQVRQRLAAPISIDGQEGIVTASIGIAFATEGTTCDADALLRDADVALFQAKAAGRNTYIVFRPSMNVRTFERWQMENDLRKAIERGELVLHFQPILETATGRIATLEALVRWQHPVLDLIPPSIFVPLAEETGLVVPMGEWVIAEACRWLRSWQLSHPDHADLSIAVNLSARQFRQPGFLPIVEGILSETALPPAALELEITEQALIEDVEAAAHVFLGLRDLGVRTAIDDFGTGFCSLTYLRRFAAGELKIDRSFAPALLPRDKEHRLLALMVSLGHTLGMGVTMEGIETPEQATAAREMGFDRGQGYFFARPLDRQAVETYLAYHLAASKPPPVKAQGKGRGATPRPFSLSTFRLRSTPRTSNGQ